jgi:hypothetical protein
MFDNLSVTNGAFMKFVYGALIATSIFIWFPAQAQDATKVASAEAAALQWLTHHGCR